MADEKRPDRQQVPKPPSDKAVEEISRAQEYITDDWTGEGGRPKPQKKPKEPR